MSQLVHIVDDDASYRTAIGRLLRAHGYETAEYHSAPDFLLHIEKGAPPGCIVLDVRMPDLSGPELQARLAESGLPYPIVFVTGHGDVPTSVRAIKAGAEDFLTKPVSAAALLAAIANAFERYEVEHSRFLWLQQARARLAGLTPREREVFDHVARGKPNKLTAHALGITERTVKAHRQRIFEKLGAKSVADLVSLAERLGVLADPPSGDRPGV